MQKKLIINRRYLILDSNYFKNTKAFIKDNLKLRTPQREAYQATLEGFKNNNNHKIIILPTGTGKTGLMGLLPFGLSDGKVLIITPGLIIREGISDAFDTRSAFNFWTNKKIIFDDNQLPSFYRYAGFNTQNDKKRILRFLNESNIIVTNIQKVHGNSNKTLTKLLDKDFFDMIIIDEAHHAEADSWKSALEHFSASKVIKLTATPFRNDLKELQGDVIYNYSMANAIRKNYIKNLVNDSYTTEHLLFEVNGEQVDKETALAEMDSNWVSRSVAYSIECSKTIVNMSLKKLEEKRAYGKAHHQIIAVACSIEHAKQISRLYNDAGYTAQYISSEDIDNAEKAIIEYKKGQIDVLVNVNMLGEGFDHPNISIAAIFRPFRSLAPYAQFIGRALRRINDPKDVIDSIDNIAHVIYHKELDLDELWQYYSGEQQRAKIQVIVEQDGRSFSSREASVGDVSTTGEIINQTETFLNDGAHIKYKTVLQDIIEEKEKKFEEDIDRMRQAGISEDLIEQHKVITRRNIGNEINKKRELLREELIREELHSKHRELINTLLTEFFIETGIDPKGDELPSNSTVSFLKEAGKNDAYAVIYINSNLKRTLKRGIDEWETYDFQLAENSIPKLVEKLREKVNNIKRKEG